MIGFLKWCAAPLIEADDVEIGALALLLALAFVVATLVAPRFGAWLTIFDFVERGMK